MELTVFWTSFSKNELRKIFRYYKEKAGIRIAKSIVLELLFESSKLTSHPEIGQKEEFLITRKEEFRYLVVKNYKIIYWVNVQKNQVEIVDIFDTRQNPIKMKRNTSK